MQSPGKYDRAREKTAPGARNAQDPGEDRAEGVDRAVANRRLPDRERLGRDPIPQTVRAECARGDFAEGEDRARRDESTIGIQR